MIGAAAALADPRHFWFAPLLFAATDWAWVMHAALHVPAENGAVILPPCLYSLAGLIPAALGAGLVNLAWHSKAPR